MGEWAMKVYAGDMNGNGSSDLLAISQFHPQLCVFMNHGDGTFASFLTTRVDGLIISVAVGDLDGDNISDVAVATNLDVSFLSNNGDGSLKDPTLILERESYGIVSCDLDGDLDNDLVFTGSDTMYVLLGNGNGIFDAPVEYEAGGSRDLISSDLDGDSDIDLVAFFDSISIFLNDGYGNFTRSSSFGAQGWTYSLAACDLDGDSDNDLASNTGCIWLNNGDGTFQPLFNCGLGSGYVSINSSDLDGDGDFDLAAVNYNSMYSDDNYVSVFLNNGDATFTPAYNYGLTGMESWWGCLSDLDGDGDEDMAVVSVHSGHVLVMFNTTIR